MFAALGYEISAPGFVFGVWLSRKDCDGVSVSFVPSGPASGEREDSWNSGEIGDGARAVLSSWDGT